MDNKVKFATLFKKYIEFEREYQIARGCDNLKLCLVEINDKQNELYNEMLCLIK